MKIILILSVNEYDDWVTLKLQKSKKANKKKEKEMKRRRNKTTGQKGKLSSLFPYWAGKLLLFATKWQVLEIEAGASWISFSKETFLWLNILYNT